ncbi:15 kDa protein B-like [Dasypus novemcinctus]|uniref:15 kDa protein B-like n=1 Tax=Dasypus novemcinctus TaxID=9361 RepID=UPI0026604DE2|nr:15 kDa protein B-like [Dasypus novemcinctus]
MAGAWRALLLVVGLAAVACVAHRRPSYERIVDQAVRFLNQGRRGGPLFRLLEATPPPRGNTTSRTIPLNFRIKETVCLSSQQRPPQECPFREGGEERDCSGSYTAQRRTRVLLLECSRQQGPPRQVSPPELAEAAEVAEAAEAVEEAAEEAAAEEVEVSEEAEVVQAVEARAQDQMAAGEQAGEEAAGEPGQPRKPPSAPAAEIDTSKLPPAIRDMYEKAKYDIISHILSNF